MRQVVKIVLAILILHILLETIAYFFIPSMFYYYNLPFIKIFSLLPNLIQNLFDFSKSSGNKSLLALNASVITGLFIILIGAIIELFPRKKKDLFSEFK